MLNTVSSRSGGAVPTSAKAITMAMLDTKLYASPLLWRGAIGLRLRPLVAP